MKRHRQICGDANLEENRDRIVVGRQDGSDARRTLQCHQREPIAWAIDRNCIVAARDRYSTTGVPFCEETKISASVTATTSCSSPALVNR